MKDISKSGDEAIYELRAVLDFRCFERRQGGRILGLDEAMPLEVNLPNAIPGFRLD